MAVTQITDVIVPSVFTSYVVQNTMERTALYTSGVAVRNGEIESQLAAGADQFTVPHWNDLGNDEANIVNDNPASTATPYKLVAGKQVVRKAFLHNSWSAMNLASELSGSDALPRIQDRATAYWDRQMQRRLVASLNGIYADNVANDSSDMVRNVAATLNSAVTTSTQFNATSVIEAAATLGDAMRDLVAIAMHSDTYELALKNDLIATVQQSDGSWIQTFRGLAVIVDDGMPYTPAEGAGASDDAAQYTSVLFGRGAVGFGVTAPRIAKGTEVENKPSAGNGGGQQILHSRVNLAIHPSGFRWLEGSVAADSPSIAELALAANWSRDFERKAIPLAFLRHN